MRLIDRIKVLEDMLGIMFQEGQESAYYDDKIEIGAMTIKDVVYEDGKSDGLDIAYNMIADAPEIKAIPIEWLKNKAKDLADAYWNNVRNKLVLNMNELPLVIDEMIRIWEKENADNN